jgi:phosphate-selective porin OprO/OprP
MQTIFTRVVLELVLAGLAVSGAGDGAKSAAPAPHPGDGTPPVVRPAVDGERLETLEERVARLEAGALPAKPDEPSVAAQEKAPDPGAIRAFWKNGFKFETADKQFTAQFGGRIHFDAGGIDTDDDFEAGIGGDEEDAAEFRRARIYMSGTLHEIIEYKWQYDFAGGVNNRFKDVYMGLKDTPVGGVRVGQFKEPFSLEELTSSNHRTFMESGTLNALVPQRNIGIMVHDHNQSETFTWAAGLFKDDGSDTGAHTGDGETNATARVTFLPVYENEGEDLVHLGAAYSLRASDEGMIDYASAGPSGLTQNDVLDTGSIAADSADLFGLEAAWVRGPLSLQGEFVRSSVDADSGSDPDLDGWYVFASWFLTGEHRAYKTASGAFDRVAVERPYGKNGGWGAWELAARYGMLDLSDASVDGGELTDTTLGLNWYLNPFARIMFNWVHEELEPSGGGPDGEADIYMVRFAFEF